MVWKILLLRLVRFLFPGGVGGGWLDFVVTVGHDTPVMKPLILFPYNGNAREAVGVVDAINRVEPTWSLLGFIDDDPSLAHSRQGNYPVLGIRDRLRDYPDAQVLAVPGRPDNYWARLSLIDSLSIAKERFATLVHPAARIGPECSLGPNTLLHGGVVLTASVQLEGDVVILPNTVLSLTMLGLTGGRLLVPMSPLPEGFMSNLVPI